jgi:glycerophosphoryl diester phosphodiesterase
VPTPPPTPPPKGQRERHIEIIAHRGTPREHPENSLPGFQRALECGADGIELDVHLTSDGVVVVHHDPTLSPADRAIDTPRSAIRELALADVQGRVLAPGVPIPTLAEVLDLVGRRAVVYIEVKARGAEAAVVRCIRKSATTCAVHGFDHRVALRAASLDAGLPTGILLDSYLIDPAAALGDARARDYWQRWEMIDADLVARIHAARGRVIAWTVNEPAVARQLQTLGVDAVCTDVCGAVSKEIRGETNPST